MDPLSTLLSIAGRNRAIGSGDVTPYQRTSTDSPTASEAQAATPGPSSPGPSFDPFSSLSNLSALTPQYNAAIQALLAGSVPSGTANAVATPLPGATPGPSSNDIASQAQIGSVPIAGAPGTGLAPAPVVTAAPASAPVVDTGATSGGGSAGDGGPGGAPGGPAGGEAGTVGDGTAGGIGGSAPGGEGGGGVGSGGGDGSGGVGGDGGGGGGVYKKGGLVTAGNPKSKTDDVPAKLQHGEFVIPREAVLHLAATAPAVLSHVMQVSAAHALANKARGSQPSPGALLTGRNGMPPKPMAQGGPVGYRNGGLVIPAGVAPQLHPAVANALRQAIALHEAANATRPLMPRPQMAQPGSSAVASQGRPPAMPPITPSGIPNV
jgi:hypothetical protein